MAKYFGELRKRLNNFKKLDADVLAWKLTRTARFKELVIYLNTQKQLFEKGENSLGEKLSDIGGGYSPVTLLEAQRKGRPKKGQDHVDLRDTGEFYDSFAVIPYKGGFEIEADPIKEETNLFEEWGVDVVGLNEESKQTIINEYVEHFKEEIKKI